MFRKRFVYPLLSSLVLSFSNPVFSNTEDEKKKEAYNAYLQKQDMLILYSLGLCFIVGVIEGGYHRVLGR